MLRKPFILQYKYLLYFYKVLYVFLINLLFCILYLIECLHSVSILRFLDKIISPQDKNLNMPLNMNNIEIVIL